jgi:hypothetical protein
MAMPEPEEFKFFAWIVGTMGTVLGFAFGAGSMIQRYKGRLISMENSVTLLNKEIKTRLYNNDGTLIYITGKEFEKEQGVCQKNIAAHLKQIDDKLNMLLSDKIKKGP